MDKQGKNIKTKNSTKLGNPRKAECGMTGDLQCTHQDLPLRAADLARGTRGAYCLACAIQGLVPNATKYPFSEIHYSYAIYQ